MTVMLTCTLGVCKYNLRTGDREAYRLRAVVERHNTHSKTEKIKRANKGKVKK